MALGTPPRGLHGQWAVVTGGSKGIGRAIAERLLESGSNIVVVARNRADIDAAVTELCAKASAGQLVVGLTADIADRASVTALFDDLHQRIPRLDHFIANAGTGRVTPFFELTPEETDEVVALNFTGTILCMQLAAKMMLSTRSTTHASSSSRRSADSEPCLDGSSTRPPRRV